MKQEDKELLLKDISARLPYNLIVHIHDLDVTDYDNYLYPDYLEKMMSCSIRLKPYLRPISSITEEEVDKLFDILNLDKKNETEWLKVNDSNIIRLFTQDGKDFYEIAEAMDYLYSIHVDFRGLLWKNLAIEVTEENNPYKR